MGNSFVCLYCAVPECRTVALFHGALNESLSLPYGNARQGVRTDATAPTE